MTTPEALKALYVALGGSADDIATANTSVDVLNAIAVKFEGDGDATLNPDAIMNVVSVLDNIIPEPTSYGSEFFYNPNDGSGGQFYISNINIEKLTVPEGYKTLSNTTASGSIYYAEFLKEIHLPSTITSMITNIFRNMTALEKITINKPEGSLSGAPWGAPETCEIVWLG